MNMPLSMEYKGITGHININGEIGAISSPPGTPEEDIKDFYRVCEESGFKVTIPIKELIK